MTIIQSFIFFIRLFFHNLFFLNQTISLMKEVCVFLSVSLSSVCSSVMSESLINAFKSLSMTIECYNLNFQVLNDYLSLFSALESPFVMNVPISSLLTSSSPSRSENLMMMSRQSLISFMSGGFCKEQSLVTSFVIALDNTSLRIIIDSWLHFFYLCRWQWFAKNGKLIKLTFIVKTNVFLNL